MPHRALLGLIVAALVLATLEVSGQLALAVWPEAARLRPLDPGGQLYAELEFHPDLLWRLVPGERNEGGVPVRVNALRARGGPLEDGHRVLFLGDSSVFGWGVEEAQAFAWRSVALAEESAPSSPPRVVFNAATPGYSSSQARLQLDALLPLIEPSVVVIATLWSDMMQTGWTDRELFARFGSGEQAEALGRHDLLAHSALFRLARAALLSRRPVPQDRRVLWGSIFEGDRRGGMLRATPAEHRAHLDAMVDQAQGQGASPILLILPTHTGTDQRPPDRQLADYHANFSAVAAARGVPVVDTNDAFAAQPDPAPLFLDPVHPSARGHALIAEALAPVLAAAPLRRER